MNLNKHLPGQTPLDDISGLKCKWVRNISELSEAEFANSNEAYLKYLSAVPSGKISPFTYEWMLKLHGEMFGKVWNWAGKQRTCELNLGVEPGRISVELHSLSADVAVWTPKSHTDAIELSCMLHYRAVKIHPFLGGNGRWSRLLGNIWLLQKIRKIVKWPEATLSSTSPIREQYLDSLKQADAGDYDSMIKLHERHVVDFPFGIVDANELKP